MNYGQLFILFLLLKFRICLAQGSWTFRCPCNCDMDEFGRKRITCSGGRLKDIPIRDMDTKAQVLVIMGTNQEPNDLTIGRIFLEFDLLEEITIRHSQIPAIGDSTFWPGKKIHLIDLSYNRIEVLKTDDFNGLTELSVLNLSNNLISTIPSAVFHQLNNLTKLSLAHNKLGALVPRMFMKLSKLERLELSGNPLSNIEPDDIRDLKSLKVLLASKCGLSKLHSLVYHYLPNLEELDLRENFFSMFSKDEFKSLKHLRILLLDGNKIITILDGTFHGLKLDILAMSRNEMVTLQPCAFCGADIKTLDISRNKFKLFDEAVFASLKTSIISLNAEENNDFLNPERSVHNMLHPLRVLRTLSISSMSLGDSLPSDAFSGSGRSLKTLDMSRNRFGNVSVDWFRGLESLEELDLSGNQITSLKKEFFTRLDQMKTLTALYIFDNPFSCFRCHVLDLMDWINRKPSSYLNVCGKDERHCVKCDSPGDLVGMPLNKLSEFQLEWCSDPSIKLRVVASEPKVGLVLAVLIILSLVVVIIAVVLMYRKHGATYYTHEEERMEDKTIFMVDKNYRKSMVSPPFSPPPNSCSRSLTPPDSPLYSPCFHSTSQRPSTASHHTPHPTTVHRIASISRGNSISGRNSVAHSRQNSISRSPSIASIPPPPPLPPPSIPKSETKPKSIHS